MRALSVNKVVDNMSTILKMWETILDRFRTELTLCFYLVSVFWTYIT